MMAASYPHHQTKYIDIAFVMLDALNCGLASVRGAPPHTKTKATVVSIGWKCGPPLTY